jgi:hypothetical protein
MTPKDVLNYFGTTYRFGKETKIKPHTLSSWIKKGYIPLNSQVMIERFTNGALKIDYDHIK